MKKILKNNQKTARFLNKLPKIYLVVTWAHAGYREYPFAGKCDKEGTPLVYFYDDHNGTSDNYYLIPITDTTTGFIDGWTFSIEEAEKRVEELNQLEEDRQRALKEIKLFLTPEKEEEVLNNIREKLKQQKPFEVEVCDHQIKCTECKYAICDLLGNFDLCEKRTCDSCNAFRCSKTVSDLLELKDEHSFEPHTKDECFELICGIAYDYDGYRDAKNLMELIDEIKEIAEKGWRMKK